jgi:hypothetical protein
VIQEKQIDSDDSSDDEYSGSRNKRGDLARALFGNILPQATGSGSRPGSTGPGASPTTSAPPKAPPAALAKLGGSAPPESRGALFAAIQGGARLKKAQTVDKSGPPVSGRVIGDSAPPAHINTALREPSPPPAPRAPLLAPEQDDEDEYSSRSANRQSVDWYGGLAADTSHPQPVAGELTLASTREEDETVHESADAEGDLDEFDLTRGT